MTAPTKLPADWKKVPGWVCDLGNGDFDHDWEIVDDWMGDPDVINGTMDCSYKRCRQCGEETALDLGERYRLRSYEEDWA